MQFVCRVVGTVASMGTVAITTRHLGPETYGHLATATMFVALWLSLTELGIGSVIVRRASGAGDDLERLVRVNVGLSSLYCLPLGAITALVGWAVYRETPQVVHMIAIVSGSLVLTSMASCFQPVFQANVRFNALAVADVIGRVGALAATVILVLTDAQLVWFAVVQLVPPAAQLVVQGIAATRFIDVRPIFSVRESWELLKQSAQMSLVLIIAMLYWRFDGVILSLRSTAEQVGVYNLAYSIAFTTTAVSMLYAASTLATMSHLYVVDLRRFADFVTRGVEAMLFVGAPIAFVGTILAAPIVRVFGSEDFVADGAPTFALLSVAVAVAFCTTIVSQAMFTAHDQSFLLRLNVLNLIGNIVLNVLLTGPLGAVGAAIALVVSEVIGLVVAVWRLGRRSPFRVPWMFILRLAVPVAASAAVAHLLRDYNVVLAVGAAAAAYVLTNVAVGPVTVRMVRGMMSRTDDDEENPSEMTGKVAANEP